MNPLKPDEIRGNWATLICAWNKDESLDSGRVANEIDRMIEFGVDGIYSNGTAGEFHTQSEKEFDQISGLLAEKCEAANTPFQLGVGHMSAQISLDRLKRSVALKPSACQVILPDWFPVTNEEAISFLDRMAEAADGIGLVLYNPPHAKRVLRPAEFADLVKAVPAVVGVKTAGGDAEWYAEMRDRLEEVSVFIPGHYLASGIRDGARGSYSNMASMNPRAAQCWYELTQTDLDAALKLEERVVRFITDVIGPFISEQHYANPACDRFLVAVGDWADLGEQMRWPYRTIPKSELDRIRSRGVELIPEFFEF